MLGKKLWLSKILASFLVKISLFAPPPKQKLAGLAPFNLESRLRPWLCYSICPSLPLLLATSLFFA
jgi:hypothetical protein